MKINYIHLIIMTILVALTACDEDFESINVNPNNPENVSPDLLMVTAIRGTVNDIVIDGFNVGNIVAQYATEIREPNVDRYIWLGSFGTWNDGYNNLRNVVNLQKIAEDRGHENYQGIALVLKSILFQRITDAYGMLPYEEALQGKTEGIYFPDYDSQEEVYQGIIADLEQANQLLSSNGGNIDKDILYNGDHMKWRKLANSLKMRVLVRQSNQVDPSARLREMVNNPQQYPIFESNADQATLDYIESPNYYPLANYRSGHFLDRRLSKRLADQLNSTGDPRIKVFARPTQESQEAFQAGNGELQWAGVLNGETDDNLGSNIDDKVSAFGEIYYVDQQEQADAEGIIMTYSELQFILAEAAARGWINGDAESYYLEGIEASIAYYSGVSGRNLEPEAGFYQQEGIAFEEENALVLIGTQKWISLFSTGLQGWFEWRRTGFPNLQPALVNNNDDQIPVRFRYPTDQQVTNEDNYQEAISTQGADNINTLVWWDKQ